MMMTWTASRAWPTTLPTACPPTSGPAMWASSTSWPARSAPARCRSMGVRAWIRPCPLAATSSPAGVASTAAPALKACWRPRPSALRYEAAAHAQVEAHAQRVFAALVVARHQRPWTIAQRFIEAPGPGVGSAQLQGQQEGAGHQCAFMQPVHELPPEPAPLMRALNGEQIQMGAIIAELHDGESGQHGVKAGGQDHAIGTLDVAKYALGRPRRRQPCLDEASRQGGDGRSVARRSQLETVVVHRRAQ